MPSLYVDCVGGVAGDMLLASLIDAGASLDAVRAGLPIGGLDLRTEHVERQGLAALALSVITGEDQAHRTWRDVRTLIDSGSMPERARARAQAAFALLADAEGRVHGVPADEVTFHEVGALDAIADICGVALALEDLGIDDVVCSPLPLGRGVTRSAHGLIPLPAPATLALLRGAKVYGVDAVGETRLGLVPEPGTPITYPTSSVHSSACRPRRPHGRTVRWFWRPTSTICCLSSCPMCSRHVLPPARPTYGPRRR